MTQATRCGVLPPAPQWILAAEWSSLGVVNRPGFHGDSTEVGEDQTLN